MHMSATTTLTVATKQDVVPAWRGGEPLSRSRDEEGKDAE
jgi:hypothetical protein